MAFFIVSSILACILPGTAIAAYTLQPAPDFLLTNLNGQTVSLSISPGRDTLIIFGTTSCPHCDAFFPVLEKLSENLSDDMKILFIAVGQNARQVVDFFGNDIPPYDILPDETRIVSSRYGIKRIPTCVFIDEKGLIQYIGRANEGIIWLIDEKGLIQYIGRANEGIIWRLWSGERPIYPDTPYNDLHASDRLSVRAGSVLPRAKRFIVELDEKPGFWKRLSRKALKTQRAHFRQSTQRIGGRKDCR